MGAQPFRFLELPREIRNYVYMLLLCNFEAAVVLVRSDRDTVARITQHKYNIETAILATNRQIHSEARGILLQETQFVKVDVQFQDRREAIKGIFVPTRVPIFTLNRDVINKFGGHTMSYTLAEEAEEAEAQNSSFVCMILHRDFDLLCRALVNADFWMPGFGSKTKHTIVLHQSLSRDQQERLLAPFRRRLRGLKAVAIYGEVEPSLAKAVVSEAGRNHWQDPESIIEDLRKQEEVGSEYQRSGNSKMCSETWERACVQIKRLRNGPSWNALAYNRTLVGDLSELWFNLNMKLAQSNIENVQREARDDPHLAAGNANSALGALQNALDRLSDSEGWEPSQQQVTNLWCTKAKVHRLRGDYSDARNAIGIAEKLSPNDPMVLGEKTLLLRSSEGEFS